MADVLDKLYNKQGLRICSFCGKDEHEVKNLIAGPTVFICDECVELCADILCAQPNSNRQYFINQFVDVLKRAIKRG